ncbi:hypothetical protein ABPG74_017767 [Tetrahymena malaccensis]
MMQTFGSKRSVNVEQFDQNYYFFCNRPETVVPDAYELFQFYDAYFFQNRLEACEMKWSKRMTSCAGTCKHSSYNSCTITLSESLLQYRNSNELKETLLHEMIHAYLFLTNPKACLAEGGHGEEFKSLMSFINSVTGLNITVYHSFIDEVELFKVHVWKCNGPCQNQPPYFGTCKRQMNRPPQKSDTWFESHQKNCGGQFIKIDGPEFGDDGKPDPSKQVVKKTKKEKNGEESNSSIVQNKRKQKKNETKVDNLQSLISRYMISDIEKQDQSQNNQREITQNNSNFKEEHKKPQFKDIISGNGQYGNNLQNSNQVMLNQNSKQQINSNQQVKTSQKSNEELSLEQFVFLKKDKPQYSSNSNIYKASQYNQNNNKSQFQNQIIQQQNNQKILQKDQNFLKEQKNDKQIFQYKSDIIKKNEIHQTNDFLSQFQKNQIQSASSLDSEESIEFLQSLINKQRSQQLIPTQQNSNIQKFNNENTILQQQQQSSQKSQNNTLEQSMENCQVDQISENEQILSQVKIQIAFSRDKSFNKEAYFIYLINTNFQLIDVADLLQKIYNLDDKVYSLKNVIQELNGQDIKIENYPNFQLNKLNEHYQILFDFGSLKIYFKELKNIDLKTQNPISRVFKDAIYNPQLQQQVNLQNK